MYKIGYRPYDEPNAVAVTEPMASLAEAVDTAQRLENARCLVLWVEHPDEILTLSEAVVELREEQEG